MPKSQNIRNVLEIQYIAYNVFQKILISKIIFMLKDLSTA